MLSTRLNSKWRLSPRLRSFAVIALLSALIIMAVTLRNWEYFFHARAYEFNDQAANSLDVLRCKKFQDYLGAYSRWGFHHPGPFLFYCFAAGETVFWQLLHVTRTPLTAQVLTTLCLTALFFAAGVGIAARWVRSPFFVPLALLLATLHYTAMYLSTCMLDTWTPYVSPMPYFCLLVAAASVAAGQGADLPWLMFAGCALIHIHVANPLFVVPLFTLAYAGLLWTCRHERSILTPSATLTMWPWRRHPRAHLVAASLAALFVLPVVIDLCHGSASNFALILNHLHTHAGQRYPYRDATYYLLRFGAYRPIVGGDVKVALGTPPGMITHFLIAHLKMGLIWIGALFSPLLALALRAGLKPLTENDAKESCGRLYRDRWRFLSWLMACFTLCTLLALYWAHIQDGELLYYNAWYVFSLYGILTLVASIAMSDALEQIVERFRHPKFLSALIPLLCFAATVAYFEWSGRPERTQAYLGDFDGMRAQTQTVLTALAQHPQAPRTKLLVIPNLSAVDAAAGVAILLKRQGYEFRVLPQWKVMLGNENALSDSWVKSGDAMGGAAPMELWWIVQHIAVPGEVTSQPLWNNKVLRLGYSEIDPAKESAIVFGGPARNSETYAQLGFTDGLADMPAVWTVDNIARMVFESRPVPPDTTVEIAFDFWPPLIDNTTHPTQRLQVRYNNTTLGTLIVGAKTSADAIRVRMPATLWNAQPIGVLVLGFPDAISPVELTHDDYGDPRLLGFSAKKITFRVVQPAEAIPVTP